MPAAFSAILRMITLTIIKHSSEYIKVKKSFFDGLPSSAFAITNADDKNGDGDAAKYQCKANISYSLKTTADFKGKILENNLTGLVMTINDQEVHFRLIGEFNAYNLLAVYGAAICLGEEKADVLQIPECVKRRRGTLRLYRIA